MAAAGFKAIMRSSRKLRASLTPSPSKPQIRKYPSLSPSPLSNQKRKLTAPKKIVKSQSYNGLASQFRNLSLTPIPQPPRSISPRKPRSGNARDLSTKPVSSIVDIANLIKDEKCKNIIVMAGAGISTPSGIPDFRTPGTGLYDNLQEYNIPEPTAIFDIEYFWYDPRPFFCLAKTLYPGNFQPNYVHYFINLLNEKGLLLKMYSQNIDGLERLAGLPEDKIVEAHGTFSSASCIKCRQKYDGDMIKKVILKGDIPRCIAPKCKGVIKPDIVFFGEDLPKKFYSYEEDFPKCDLLIVMGTSLEVEPFAGIVSEVTRSTPRLLINRETVGPFASTWKGRRSDVVLKGDVVTGVKRLVKLLEWTDVMNDIIKDENKKWKSKEEQELAREKPDSSVPSSTEAAINLATKSTNGTGGNDSRNYHTFAGNLTTKLNTEIENVEDRNSRTLTQNSILNSFSKECLPPAKNLEKEDKVDVKINSKYSTRTIRLLAGNGTMKFTFTGKSKELNQSSTSFDNSINSSQVRHPPKDSLLSCNSVARQMPLLPFRYTHRPLLELSDANYKSIDPNRDLASAGFGMGRQKSDGSKKCYISSSDSDTSSSNDNSSSG